MNKLSNFVTLAGNASQIIIAGSILADIYLKLRAYYKKVADNTTDDDGDNSPSPQPTPLAA